jgi:hypothetical protein
MDSRALKMAKVFDFKKVRLVTVVTWVEGTDTEAEAVRSAEAGLDFKSKGEKRSRGFQLTIFEKYFDSVVNDEPETPPQGICGKLDETCLKMDARKLKPSTMFNVGKVRLFRVVTWMEEQEAGAKAAAREKMRLGYNRKGPKLLGSFKAILFQKHLKRKYCCVLCDFESYESDRKGEKLENFLHPEQTTDFGVLCIHCGHFQCRICLVELHTFAGISCHSDFQYLNAYIHKEPHLARISSCSCCSLKKMMLKPSVLETSGKPKAIRQQWDGMLWFPEYGLVIPSSLGTFDLHALAQLNTSELGVLHGLVSPEVAYTLEESGVEAGGTTRAASSSTTTVQVVCQELNRTVDVKVKVCIYARSEITFTEDRLGSDIKHEEAKHCTCVLTEEEMETAHQNGIDIICIVGAPRDVHLKDAFLLVGRVLPSSRLLGKLKFDPNALFQELKKKLPRKGYESRRFGGSSGKTRVDNDLLRFVNNAGTTCRQGIGTVLLPNADLRNWDFLYKSAYSQEFKRVRYSPPVRGGQVDPERIEWNNRTSGFAEAYATTKTLLPYILAAVNMQEGNRTVFAVSAVQDELRIIKAAFKQSLEEKIPFMQVILLKHTITFLQTAVRLHRDVVHRSPNGETRTGNKSFLEYKFVFEVPSETGRLLTLKSPLARLRGGAGRLRAAVAAATHRKNN